MRRSMVFFVFPVVVSLAGCGQPVEEAQVPPTVISPPEIVGVWESNFGEIEDISEESWGDTTLVAWDNAENWAVRQNAADAEYFPSTFSKVVWTEPGDDGFYYCTVAFGLDTAAAAENSTNVADTTDPATSGCGDFSWTKLSAQ